MSKKIRLTIQEWRRAKRKTAGEMAKQLGCTTPTYRTWEASPMRCRLGDLVEIMKILDVDPDQVRLTDKEEEDENEESEQKD